MKKTKKSNNMLINKQKRFRFESFVTKNKCIAYLHYSNYYKYY